MAEVENLVLEQLRLIRDALGKVDERFEKIDRRFDALSEKVDDLALELRGHSGLLIALAGYVKSIDERVEHLEHGWGGPAA